MKNTLLIFSFLVLTMACRKEIVVQRAIPTNTTNTTPNTETLNGLTAPENFKWQFLQDYLITLTADTLIDSVSFALYSDDAKLVYNGIFNFGYSSFSLRVPRDVKYLLLVSYSSKIVPAQTINLQNPTSLYNDKVVIKTIIQANKLWTKKSNDLADKNEGSQLFKGGDITSLWSKNEYLYTRTLFEDLWPSTADYDFNDMVVDNLNSLNFRTAGNKPAGAKRPIGLGNKVVNQLKGTYVVQANGAGFNNGLAVQLFGEYYNQDGSITPINNLANYISNCKFTNSSGKANSGAELETLPNGDVVLVLFARINDVKASIYQNTDAKTAFGLGDTIFFTIDLNTEIDKDYWQGRLCTFRYSHPFLLQNGDRSMEIHVAGEKPTLKANTAIFGTGEDNTNLSTGKTYLSKKKNLPWALSMPSSFVWPTEKVEMVKAYPNFSAWVLKNGVNINEWRYNKLDSLIKQVN